MDEFLEQHPECTKNSVEKKIKDLFVKEKRDLDPK